MLNTKIICKKANAIEVKIKRNVMSYVKFLHSDWMKNYKSNKSLFMFKNLITFLIKYNVIAKVIEC